MNLVMGTKERRTRKREARRQDILEKTKELFKIKGLSSTTMEDIASRAEISPGTTYLYFKNKEEIYASINLMTLQFIFEETRKVFNNKNLDPGKKILELKNAFYRAFEHDPLILKNIIRFQLEDGPNHLSPELLQQINTLTGEAISMMADIYKDGVYQGMFRNDNSITIADTIWAIFTGLMIYEEAKRTINPKKNFFKSTLDKAFNIFYRGIQNPVPREP
jgi:AcrR family transcriptional regulator